MNIELYDKFSGIKSIAELTQKEAVMSITNEETVYKVKQDLDILKDSITQARAYEEASEDFLKKLESIISNMESILQGEDTSLTRE
mgnify:CR=1 FL=1